MRKSSNWTLGILLALATAAVAAFPLLPWLRQQRILSNEYEVYRALTRRPGLSLPPELAAADPDNGRPVPFHGYYVRALGPRPGDEPGYWEVWAWPTAYGKTGRTTYVATPWAFFKNDTGGVFPQPTPPFPVMRRTWSIID